MRHDKLGRELDLLLLLVENHNYTSQDLCERLGITRRNLYYYLDFFRDAGFNLIKSGRYYRLNRTSRFFRKLHECIDFTEEEAIYLRRLLEGANQENPFVVRIQQKLERFYDLRILTDSKLREQVANNVNKLYEAIKNRQIVKLKNYSSPHSKSVSDRVVEPFRFLNDNSDIQCYELASGKNKIYKVSRMEDVEIIDLLWSHEAEHRQLKTDIFMFSGEETFPVSMLLGQLACNLFKEEYPQAKDSLALQDDGRWLLQLDVCDYRGIGRFVLGLWNDVEVLSGEGFKQYLRAEIEKMKL